MRRTDPARHAKPPRGAGQPETLARAAPTWSASQTTTLRCSTDGRATLVDAVAAAKGRTSDDLGTDYPKISEQLWTAVQEALSGSSSPADALTKAQKAAKSALS